MTSHSRQGDIPHRTVRVPDNEWGPAMERARQNGETMTDVVRRALRRYAKAKPKSRGLPEGAGDGEAEPAVALVEPGGGDRV